MHSRARMVVASFLSKDLYVDWRLGAAHFMSLLVDGDVANNQLNWQWVAGTGTDTNPNRVFNPVLQGRRFDPAGNYIRRYLPELAKLDAREIHWPDIGTRRQIGYSAPISTIARRCGPTGRGSYRLVAAGAASTDQCGCVPCARRQHEAVSACVPRH